MIANRAADFYAPRLFDPGRVGNAPPDVIDHCGHLQDHQTTRAGARPLSSAACAVACGRGRLVLRAAPQARSVSGPSLAVRLTARRNLVSLKQSLGRRHQEAQSPSTHRRAAVEPQIERALRDDNAACANADRARSRFACVVMMAAVSISSPLGPIHVSHRPANAMGARSFGRMQNGRLRPAVVLPFVKPVGGKQAPAPAHGIAEGGLVVDRLRARIDEQAESARVLDPGGISPQRTSANCRSPSAMRTIGTGCVGATL